MSSWTSGEDALIKIGEVWVRLSSVAAVEPIGGGASRIYLTIGKEIVVHGAPTDEIVEAMFKRGRP